MAIPEWMDRTRLLTGDDGIIKLQNAHVLVAGLGGVGGYAAEMLCRAGVGKLTIVDGDTIHVTNINRQVIAMHSTIGLKKTEVMKERLRDINPECEVKSIHSFLRDQELIDLVSTCHFDYVIDAIDTLSPKVFLIYYALKNNLRVVSSMGSGGKLSVGDITIGDISETRHCPLARMVRKRLHKMGVFSGFKVVYSTEKVNHQSWIESDQPNKKTITGTISYMPAVFGCFLSSVVICDMLGYCE